MEVSLHIGGFFFPFFFPTRGCWDGCVVFAVLCAFAITESLMVLVARDGAMFEGHCSGVGSLFKGSLLWLCGLVQGGQ